jgi:hypothetical protein
MVHMWCSGVTGVTPGVPEVWHANSLRLRRPPTPPPERNSKISRAKAEEKLSLYFLEFISRKSAPDSGQGLATG